ncbi:MAG: NEW3 domain-containing protein, partial [Pseudonocardiaceae bacterium]
APWTLDNPAHHWFALSSTARVALRDSAGVPVGTRAFGVAEIICPDDAAAAGGASRAVRELAVALVRAGVTATCSTGGGSRYGALDIDSNLPDIRIALGRPDQNAFTARVLAAAPAYAAELGRQLAGAGRARLWVPAERELTEVWVPGADLRGALDLPVLVLAGTGTGTGADTTADEVAAVVDDLADTAIDVRQPRELCRAGPFDDHTVALLNRGVPGFAVDPSGALHLSLMRSCTGWPSGVWIDPPRRSTPDGSGFQLQHWTHTFGYALVAGAGDWRATGLVRAGYAYNHPLRAVVTPPGGGRLPPKQAMVTTQPSDRLLLTALKPTGNALARGGRQEADPRRSITVRCYEAHGSPADARISTAWTVRSGSYADLLETPGEPVEIAGGGLTFPMAGADVATLTARIGGLPAADRPPSAAVPPPGPPREPAQPVFTRYWLHNKGPAPLGYQPVSGYVDPTSATTSGRPVVVRVSVSSDLTDEACEGLVRVTPPEGWGAEPAQSVFQLPPGGHTALDVTVTPPRGALPGTYFLSASLRDASCGAVRDGGGQVFEDVVTLTVPGELPPAVAPALECSLTPEVLTLGPGERGRLTALLRNDARAEIRGEAQLISPYGTWSMLTPWTQGFAVPAGAERAVVFDAAVAEEGVCGAPGPEGSFWALVKLMWFGRVHYTRAVRVRVR